MPSNKHSTMFVGLSWVGPSNFFPNLATSFFPWHDSIFLEATLGDQMDASIVTLSACWCLAKPRTSSPSRVRRSAVGFQGVQRCWEIAVYSISKVITAIIVFALLAQDFEAHKYGSFFQALCENLEIQDSQSICVDGRAVICNLRPWVVISSLAAKFCKSLNLYAPQHLYMGKEEFALGDLQGHTCVTLLNNLSSRVHAPWILTVFSLCPHIEPGYPS